MAKNNSLAHRVAEWAGDRVASMIWAGRTKHTPTQQTVAYARIQNLGGYQVGKDRPIIKPTPSNLRKFSRTVYARRAINRIKNGVAGLEWEITAKPGVKESSELQRQIAVATNCFNRPNNDDSFRTLLEQAAEDYLVCGAGAIEQELGGDKSRPLWMWPVDATSIQIYAGWTGEKDEARYLQTIGYGGNVGGQSGIPLRNDQLIFIKKDPSTDVPYSFGPLEIAFSAINRQLGISEYAGNVASNGQPENMLVFKGADRNTIETMRGWWRNEVEGQGQTPILGGEGAEVLALRGATDDALYLKYQEMLIREIATAFELSPINVGIEGDVNRSTAEVSEDRDWDTTMIPMARNFASYLTRETIEGKLGFHQLQFQFMGMDRKDEKATAEIFETYYKNNAITPNEQRERLALPPMENRWAEMTYADIQLAIAEKRAPSESDNQSGVKPKNRSK